MVYKLRNGSNSNTLTAESEIKDKVTYKRTVSNMFFLPMAYLWDQWLTPFPGKFVFFFANL